ncbi:MAG: histidinol dehydrogenase, partial [Polyangiales bacterium]
MFRIFEHGTAEYASALATLATRGEADLARVEPDVRRILDAVRTRGDAAIAEFTAKFEGRDVPRAKLDDDAWRAAAKTVDAGVRHALTVARDRIAAYHAHQRDPGFRTESDGVLLGQRVRPVAAAGVYAPGGKARYPSSVLMTAV